MQHVEKKPVVRSPMSPHLTFKKYVLMNSISKAISYHADTFKKILFIYIMADKKTVRTFCCKDIDIGNLIGVGCFRHVYD